MKYKFDPPGIIKSIFNEYYWNTVNQKVLLTFDDGPNPVTTPRILESLDKFSIKAVFFCVGQNLDRYSAQAFEIRNRGHLIANHTYSHKIISKLSAEELHSEITGFNKIYSDLFGQRTEFFRPPHGRFTMNLNGVLKTYGMKNVMWSLLTYDYKNDLNIVKFAVTKYLERDSIVVMHDNQKCGSIITDAIKLLVDNMMNKGFEFGEPSECMK